LHDPTPRFRQRQQLEFCPRVILRPSPPLSPSSNGFADPDLDLGQRHFWLAVDSERAAGVHYPEGPAGPTQAEAKALKRAFDPIGVRQLAGHSLSFFTAFPSRS
jgi:hypothetical protein